MKIDGFHLDGYGVHHDLSVTDLPAGLTIIAGPNEAGKTTLQHFLVGMLFGFTASNRPDHHAPLRGGTYGGRLLVSDAEGRQLTISRGARRSSLRVTGPDGPVDATELVDLLGGATKDLYQSIFAVHVDEFAELKALSDEQVRDRVFSAGIIGAGRTAQAALGLIADERDALLKPGGRSPDKYRIKRLRSALTEARTELAEARTTAKGLPALTLRAASVDRDRAQVRVEQAAIQAQRTLLAAVADLWPAWTDAAEARGELDQLGPLPALRAGIGEGLGRATHRVQDLDAVHRSATVSLEVATAAQEAIGPVGPTLEHEAAIIELVAAAPVERERLVAAIDHHARTEHLTAELTDTLAELGPECDEAWLAARPADLDAGAHLRAAANEVAVATQQRHHLVDAHRRAAADLQDAAAELSSVDHAIQRRPHHPVDRSRQAAADAALLVTLVGQREAAERTAAAAHQLAPTPAPHRTGPPALAIRAVLALAIVTLVGAAAGIATGAAVAAGVATVAGLAIGALGLRAAQQSKAAAPRVVAAPAAPATSLEVAALDQELAPVLTALGLHELPTLAEATNLRIRAEHLAMEAVQLDRDRTDAAHRRQQLDDRLARHQQRQATELAEADAAIRSAQEAWTGWLTDQGLAATLDAAGAANVVEALARARSLQRALATARADHDRSMAVHRSYVDRLQALLATTGLTVEADPQTDPLAAVAELDAALQQDRRTRRLLDEAAIALDAARQAHDQAAERARVARVELEAILAELQVSTADEGVALVERTARADVLRATIARAERDLTTKVGAAPERLSAARTLLAQADPLRWDHDLRRLDQAARHADDRIDDLTTELAHLTRERDQLERSADVPAAELHVADLEAQLVEATSRWAALTVAHQLVEGTLARYQRERQPDVVKRAAARFAQVTAGRYPRLEVRGHDIFAIDAAEREVDAAGLSTGAREQLYLCMRFALAESYAKTAPLPLLLDDVTVNADDMDQEADGSRVRRLVDTIASVATEHQVFLFTHHQSTVELLQAASPGARLLTLQRASGGRRMGLAAG